MGKERGKVNPERVRQRFSREFKLEAVRLLEQGGKPATQLAMELGIQRNKNKWGQTRYLSYAEIIPYPVINGVRHDICPKLESSHFR